MNERARIVFESIVESYLHAGEPVGSRTLSRVAVLGGASPATIRNVMADLVDMGLITAPHVSAGRVPTQRGLRLFIDGLMQRGSWDVAEREAIEARMVTRAAALPAILDEAVTMLSGLSACAGLVVAPKRETPIKQIQFVMLNPQEVLTVLVFTDGLVENRLVRLDAPATQAALETASNFLTAQLGGKTLAEARAALTKQMEAERSALDALTRRVIEAGLAEQGAQEGILIVKGASNLLGNVQGLKDLEQIRELMERLEDRQTMLRLLENTQDGQGVQIYIGSENPLFDAAGLSMVVAPTRDQNNHLVGAIGVIGPIHLNYGRIIPMVDYTAQLMGRLI